MKGKTSRSLLGYDFALTLYAMFKVNDCRVTGLDTIKGIIESEHD